MSVDYAKLIDDRRIGRIAIHRHFLKDEPNLLQRILSHVLVVETLTDWESNTQTYKCFSECFDPVDGNEIIPIYDVVITDNEYQFRRIH